MRARMLSASGLQLGWPCGFDSMNKPPRVRCLWRHRTAGFVFFKMFLNSKFDERAPQLAGGQTKENSMVFTAVVGRYLST